MKTKALSLEDKSIIAVFCTVLGALSTFLSVPILLRQYGAENFGGIAQFNVFLAMLPILEFGLIQAVIQKFSKHDATLPKANISISIMLSLSATLVLLASLAAVSLFYTLPNRLLIFNADHSGFSSIFLFLGLTLVIRLIIPCFTVFEYVQGKIARLSVINLTSIVARTLLLSLCMFKFNQAIEIYFFWFFLVSFLELLVYLLLAVTRGPVHELRKPKKKHFSEIYIVIKSALKIWILVVGWNGLIQFERLVLSVFLKPNEFAVVWILSSLAAIVMLVSAPLNSLNLPRLNAVSSKEVGGDIQRTARLYTILIVYPSIVLLCHLPSVLFLWLGETSLIDNFQLVFANYLIGNLIHIYAGFAYFVRYRDGIGKGFVTASAVFFLMQVIILYFVVSHWGALGSSFAWLLFSVLSYFIFSRKKIVVITRNKFWEYKNIFFQSAPVLCLVGGSNLLLASTLSASGLFFFTVMVVSIFSLWRLRSEFL